MQIYKNAKIIVFDLILLITLLFSTFVSVIPSLEMRLPFDFATISLTLAGFLIIGGLWKGERKTIFPIARAYIYSAIAFLIFYSTSSLIPDAFGKSMEIELSLTALFVLIFIGAWVVSVSYFVAATHFLVKFLEREKRDIQMNAIVSVLLVVSFLIIVTVIRLAGN